jgi:hypothetical protein
MSPKATFIGLGANELQEFILSSETAEDDFASPIPGSCTEIQHPLLWVRESVCPVIFVVSMVVVPARNN